MLPALWCFLLPCSIGNVFPQAGAVPHLPRIVRWTLVPLRVYMGDSIHLHSDTPSDGPRHDGDFRR